MEFHQAATIRKHIQQYEAAQPKAVEAPREPLYVDDLISSSCDVDQAYSVTTGAKSILSAAGMNLCKWTTNSPELKEKWTDNGIKQATEPVTCGNVLKVLGLVWKPEQDHFVFNLNGLLDTLKGKQNTKTSARIFNPIGFLTQFTIRVKHLFQQLWERVIGWDDQLPPDLTEEWNQWCSELPQLHLVVIPGWYHFEIQPGNAVSTTARIL